MSLSLAPAVVATLEMCPVLKVYAYLEKEIVAWRLPQHAPDDPWMQMLALRSVVGSQPKWHQIWAVCPRLLCKRVRQVLASLPGAKVQKGRGWLFDHLFSWHHVLLSGLLYCAKDIFVFSIFSTKLHQEREFSIRKDKSYQHNKN